MISLGCDHGGYKLKEAIKAYLLEKGIEVEDCGTYSEESVNYPDYAYKAASLVSTGKAEKGILVCSTGLGICMAASKVKGIRAATCTHEFMAEMTRKHNDANMLCLGQFIVGEQLAKNMVDIFLETEFEGGRHSTRVEGIAEIENREID